MLGNTRKVIALLRRQQVRTSRKGACEASLRRLRVDQIDLYQLHRIDPKVPAEEQLGALRHLRSHGKIKHIGLSEVSVNL
jgi:pyridoxine 4-dehydrogenase